ncbi:MAG: ABC transporter substrate-binding protein [Caldilineales bacterium]
MKRLLFVLLTVVLAFSMILAACSSNTTPAPVAEQPTAAPAVEQPTAAPAAPATDATMSVGASAEGAASKGLTELASAYKGEYKGTVVTMTGPFTDEDAVKFESSIKPFEDATGIDIQYEGSKEFEASITVRVQAGDAPDIVDFPQPGLLGTFAKQGKVIPVTDMVPANWLAENYLQSWRDMATIEGAEYGVWQRFNGKSLVWYPKAQFEAAGYAVPTTWAELQALQEQIAADGDTPWCVGIESGAATGWAATDWTEEFMLRTTTLENYDKWIKGELPFSSPEVKKAIETFADIWNNDKMVYGGTAAIVTTFFGDAPTPMFENPPKCWMHKQGNFITSFFPAEAKYGTDYGVFYLPGVDDAYGSPFLVAGDIMAAFSDRPEVRAVMQLFSTGEGVKGWLAAGGALGPQKDVQLDWYGSDLERDIAGLVNNATSVRFDASDLMPGEVGSGSFWKGMTDYFSGAADLDTVLAEIDASWPKDAAATGGTGGGAASVGASAEGATSKGLTELASAYKGEYKGTVVTMTGPFTDEDAVKFESSIKPFEDATGIDIQYEGSKEFEASITVRVQAGDAPDIVDFPQPGLLGTFAKQGKVIPVTDMVPANWLAENYLQSWRDMATIEGAEYGVWQRFNGKSLVWYPKAQFEAAGYAVPTTWAELQALQEQIAADGDTPWCVGIESGAATGWAATDWTEEFMLRTTTLENYDKWIKGELPFSSPEVKKAIETFADIWNNDKMVYGGTAAIVTTFFGDAPTPMFENPPKCWMHKQGNFITSFFPAEAKYGTDYGVFYLPGVDDAYGSPFLVAGDIMAAFSDRPEVRAVMQLFSTGEGVKGWLAAGGALGPQKDVQLDWYGSDLERDIAGLVNNATSVRFDASDLMPGEVGSGSFWKGMTDYFSGAADLDTVLAEIDASWPK